jgi:hypothetical protein
MRHGQVDIDDRIQFKRIAVPGIGGRCDDRRGLAIADPGQGERQVGMVAVGA